MVMTTPEKFSELTARIAMLEVKFDKIEQLLLKLTAQLPTPAQPPKPPKPLPGAPQGPHGMDYCGEPTPPELAGAGNGGGFGGYRKREDQYGNWRDPSGIWRNQLGEVIAHPGAYVPKPVGPELTRSEQLTRNLVDRVALSFNDRKEE